MKTIRHEVDFCVVGGGLAGLCAAVAAARHGVRTVLVHDRAVLGGNASSEVRVNVQGAYGSWDRSVRETGIVEEIMLETLYRNPTGNWQLWDAALYGLANFQENLTLLLNCSCNDAAAEEGCLHSVRAWQTTTQTWHEIAATLFADCSGDSILSSFCGARMREGREARREFGEAVAPEIANPTKMGMSLIFLWREMGEPQPFMAPPWVHRYETEEDAPHHRASIQGGNCFFVELGGREDTIHDTERLCVELLKMGLGLVDHFKNQGSHGAENLALEWFGFLPGKRESLRYVGDYTLTQHDLQEGRPFPDIVAYGGWPIDDHDSSGSHRKGKFTHDWYDVACPYPIPFRSLYSANIDNLMMAGRNISATHVALCSTRVMATCAVMGQAIGTGASVALKHGCSPREVARDHIGELQRLLQEDDCWLPGVAREIPELTRNAALTASAGNPEPLRNGFDRPDEEKGVSNAWTAPPGQWAEYRFEQPARVRRCRLVFDSDLRRKWSNMPMWYPRDGWNLRPPSTLVRRFRLLAETTDGQWREVATVEENCQRLVRMPLEVETRALRLVVDASWGSKAPRVFAWDVS